MRLIGAGTQDGFEYTMRETFWTAPNIVTVLRALLIPVFVWLVAQDQYMAAFWVLVVLSSTDWIDGYIARRFDQMSTVGQWLDPLADRLALITVSATLATFGIVPIWVVLAVVIPDLILSVNTYLLFKGPPPLKVTLLGKLRTACLLIGLPLALLGSTGMLREGLIPDIAFVLLALGAAMHIIASIDYFIKARREAARLRGEQARPDTEEDSTA
ncbi:MULTISPECIES: CDP-alcohol phosphatidyltransferase family protein [unclassified Nesterenkonia]|uniref:CDP-alcohol phosphatidyltransferase family protein n=1 Tax=unclassified Nesterenkonia TaxID=2629769 RepID=UPI001F4CBA69|nr:CDP-alcohol phosphatidyltransferase family protein [Nesterenkonia sp. DZ6]MCH8561919.1 CDP-alcohol phosphatidyltransferase family protein [Nesterenkonia sp. YGD6]MCH8570170.1 CDP-alcohol phosphatidyltransferase family protein [Nesterenkonia sp. AY15]